MELGDGFEVVLGPGVMDRPGSEAVGIGAEADVKIPELFVSAERWRPTSEARRAALRIAMVTQGGMCVDPHRGSFVPGLRIAVAEA